MVKSIVEQASGKVVAKSIEGEGLNVLFEPSKGLRGNKTGLLGEASKSNGAICRLSAYKPSSIWFGT